MARLLPLITRDPATDAQLIVTRLESPDSGVTIEGRFDLGWIGRLTPEQIDFVGLLLRYRTNLQKLADELGIAYNTVRSRLDEVVEAVGVPSGPTVQVNVEVERDTRADASSVIDALAAGDLSVDDAIAAIRANRDD